MIIIIGFFDFPLSSRPFIYISTSIFYFPQTLKQRVLIAKVLVVNVTSKKRNCTTQGRACTLNFTLKWLQGGSHEGVAHAGPGPSDTVYVNSTVKAGNPLHYSACRQKKAHQGYLRIQMHTYLLCISLLCAASLRVKQYVCSRLYAYGVL